MTTSVCELERATVREIFFAGLIISTLMIAVLYFVANLEEIEVKWPFVSSLRKKLLQWLYRRPSGR